MKELRIIHLFPKLLSLYGEYGNLAVLKKSLEENGHKVELVHYEDGDLDLTGADLVYVGSGTEDNLVEAARRLAPWQEAIRQSVEADTRWLVTGNAMALFGAQLTVDGENVPALNVLSYTTTLQRAKRYIGDVLGKDAQGQWFVGFVNTANVYTGTENTWLQLELNPKLGNDKQSAADGVVYHNFTGTQLIGPLLAKNPHMLTRLCRELTGEEIALSPDSNICKAYEICLRELRNRLNP